MAKKQKHREGEKEGIEFKVQLASRDIENLEAGKKVTILEADLSGIPVLITLEKEKVGLIKEWST